MPYMMLIICKYLASYEPGSRETDLILVPREPGSMLPFAGNQMYSTPKST